MGNKTLKTFAFSPLEHKDGPYFLRGWADFRNGAAWPKEYDSWHFNGQMLYESGRSAAAHIKTHRGGLLGAAPATETLWEIQLALFTPSGYTDDKRLFAATREASLERAAKQVRALEFIRENGLDQRDEVY